MKAFVSSTLLLAIISFGPSRTAHAGPPPTRTTDAVATATAEQPELTIEKENGIVKLILSANGNCGAPVASEAQMSFIGQELSAKGSTIMAPTMRFGDCTCNGGDVCCCSAGWTCCNRPGRCCCSTILNEY